MQRLSYLLIVSCLLLSSCVSFNQKAKWNRNKQNTSGAVNTTAPRVKLVSPLTTKFKITQRYRPKKNRKHQGIDLAGKKGSPIFSAGAGRVVYVGQKFSGYGKMILVDHGKGVATLYSHLNRFFVRSGQRVHKRQILGTMGKTGRATGVHLHFEVMEDKIPVNPEIYIRF